MTVKPAEVVFMQATLHQYEVLNLQMQKHNLYQFPLKSHEYNESRVTSARFLKNPTHSIHLWCEF